MSLLLSAGGAAPVAGSPWYLWRVPVNQPEQVDPPPVIDSGTLHRYRTGFQTVGQPIWSLYSRVTQQDAVPLEITPVQHRYPFAGAVAPAVTAGQTWMLWQQPRVLDAVDEPLYRIDYGQYALFWPTTSPIPPIVTIPVFTPNISGGGGFHKAKPPKRKRHKHIDKILSDLPDIYAALTHTDQKKFAGEAVQPYAATDAKVPRAQSVDWAALRSDAQAVAALMAAWHQHQIDLDDDDFWFLGG